jgi:hypothetical protein
METSEEQKVKEVEEIMEVKDGTYGGLGQAGSFWKD